MEVISCVFAAIQSEFTLKIEFTLILSSEETDDEPNIL